MPELAFPVESYGMYAIKGFEYMGVVIVFLFYSPSSPDNSVVGNARFNNRS